MINVNFHYRRLLWNSFGTFGRESQGDFCWVVDPTAAAVGVPLWFPPKLLCFLCPPCESLLSFSSVRFSLNHVCSWEFFPLLTDSSSTLHLPFSVLPSNQHFILFDLAFCSISVQLLFAPPTSTLHPPVCPSTSSSGLHYFPVNLPLIVSSVNPSDRSTPLFLLLLPGDAGSAALDGGTSVCLVRLLFALRGVFSNSSFSQPCPAHRTSLCACVRERVWECSDASCACEFVHSLCIFLTPYVHMHLCPCVLLLSY